MSTATRPRRPMSRQLKSPSRAEPQVAEETVWKKEVSFGRKASHEDAVVEAEPVVAEATTDEVVPDDQSR